MTHHTGALPDLFEEVLGAQVAGRARQRDDLRGGADDQITALRAQGFESLLRRLGNADAGQPAQGLEQIGILRMWPRQDEVPTSW